MRNSKERAVGEKIGEAIGKFVKRACNWSMLIMLVLKLIGKLNVSWWIVFSPLLVQLVVLLLALIMVGFATYKLEKRGK